MNASMCSSFELFWLKAVGVELAYELDEVDSEEADEDDEDDSNEVEEAWAVLPFSFLFAFIRSAKSCFLFTFWWLFNPPPFNTNDLAALLFIKPLKIRIRII